MINIIVIREFRKEPVCCCSSFFCICARHGNSHLRARLHHTETDQYFYVNYPFNFNHGKILSTDAQETQEYRHSFAATLNNPRNHKIELKYEGELTLERFNTEYKRHFIPTHFSELTHNCADAINFMAEYFFKEELHHSAELEMYRYYQSLCCLPNFLCCGIFDCLPFWSGITTSSDIFTQLQLLAKNLNESPHEKNGIALRSLELFAPELAASAHTHLLALPKDELEEAILDLSLTGERKEVLAPA